MQISQGSKGFNVGKVTCWELDKGQHMQHAEDVYCTQVGTFSAKTNTQHGMAMYTCNKQDWRHNMRKQSSIRATAALCNTATLGCWPPAAHALLKHLSDRKHVYPYALATCIAVHSTYSALCAGCLVSGHYSAFSAVIAWLTQRPQACLKMGRYFSD
jgi:hypothetical protein